MHDAADDLPAQLVGIHDHASVDGFDAEEDSNLAGHPVHRQPHAVRHECHGARRSIRLTKAGEFFALRSRGGVEFGQQNAPVATENRVVFEPALLDLRPGRSGSERKHFARRATAAFSTAFVGTIMPTLANVPLS